MPTCYIANGYEPSIHYMHSHYYKKMFIPSVELFVYFTGSEDFSIGSIEKKTTVPNLLDLYTPIELSDDFINSVVENYELKNKLEMSNRTIISTILDLNVKTKYDLHKEYEKNGIANFNNKNYTEAIKYFGLIVDLEYYDDKTYNDYTTEIAECAIKMETAIDEKEKTRLKKYMQICIGSQSDAKYKKNKYTAGALYNIACCYSLMTDSVNALVYFKKAVVDFGYNQLGHIQRDTDFNNIRDLDEFKDIVKTIVVGYD